MSRSVDTRLSMDAELCDEKRSHTEGFEREAKNNSLNTAMKAKGYGAESRSHSRKQHGKL